MTRDTSAILGVSDHAGWAIFVTVARGECIDRRRVALVEDGVPAMPHHHDAQHVPIEEGVALVERVQASALACARARLDELAAAIAPIAIAGIALRTCQPLPATIAERLTSYRAQNVADWVMYRRALAAAAGDRGWRVHWYDPGRALAEAPHDRIARTGAALGPPWQKDHRVAMAAAIAAAAAMR